MIRKSLIAGFAFLGLVAAGTMVGTAPAAAGYSCGPWNGWCSWHGGYGWKSHGWKNYGWGGYGQRYRGSPYGYRQWGHGHGGGYGKKAFRKGKKNHYGYRNYNRRHYY